MTRQKDERRDPVGRDVQAELRRRWRKHFDDCDRIYAVWRENGHQWPAPVTPPFPAELASLTCGAKTQKGTACKQKGIYRSGRCKWHGGLSTGPKTEGGKEQSRTNGRKGGRPRKPKT